jgi:NDP-sugar pyrophosphorylase family protein
MILCAGYGTRLKEWTRDLPKPMLPVVGVPMVEYTIRHLRRFGFDRFILNLHYLPDVIRSHFEKGARWGCEILYSHEEAPLGTAGAVIHAAELLRACEHFLVVYGDVVSNLDFGAFVRAHLERREAAATIVVHERAASNSIVELGDRGLVTRFIERPAAPIPDRPQHWVNSGIYCFGKRIWDALPASGFCDFPKDIFPRLVEEKILFGHPLVGERFAVDSPERYQALSRAVEHGMFPGS